ncbi:MAG: hypothetical protein V4549_06495 [Bacteroidota bacterium]
MEKKQLLSFHGKQEIKDKYVARVKAHAIADEIVKGQYWDNGKGCAVGCTIHDSNHGSYETELGIPRIIARLEDRIFEGLPNAEAKEFPLQFLSCIPVGVDLKNVWREFMVWLLVDEKTGVIRHAKTEQTKEAIIKVADMFKKSLTEEISQKELNEVRAIARTSYAAADAAAADAYAAAYAAAADADAAYAAAAAAAAADAAYADAAAAAAADADAAYADAAAAAAAAKKEARFARYVGMKNKLIELLSNAK